MLIFALSGVGKYTWRCIYLPWWMPWQTPSTKWSPNKVNLTRWQRFKALWAWLVSSSTDIYDAPQTMIDQAASVMLNGTKEAVGGVLEGKTRLVDKLLIRKKPRKSLLGKAWRWLRNRVVYAIDGTLNTAASLVPAWINIVDNVVGNASDAIVNIFRTLDNKEAKWSSKFFVASAAQALVDVFGKEAIVNTALKWVIAGKGRNDALFKLRGKDYVSNTDTFVYQSDRYYRPLTEKNLGTNSGPTTTP